MASQIGAENLRVTAEELRERLQSGEAATVLDARGETAWQQGHSRVPGAVRVDPENFRIDPSWPRDRFTVVYSADLHDATSALLAQALIDQGFLDVHVLRGGMQAWEAVHGPAEKK